MQKTVRVLSLRRPPGDLVALDGFYIGNLKGVGKVWQLTAVDTTTRWAICHVLLGPSNTDIDNLPRSTQELS